MKDIATVREVPAELADQLRRMPKVEIHVHLEGATDADTVWEMAQRNGVTLPAHSPEQWREHYEFRDFEHFIEVYLTATGCMHTVEDYHSMVLSFARRQAAQNVRYSEAYFSPDLHLGRRLPASAILDALEAGVRDAEREHGTRVRFLADISRHLPEDPDAVVDFAIDGHARDGLFLAIGIGGIEIGYPPELFVDHFERARSAGLRTVAHAGETAGPESVWGALRSLQAERIGHGVRSLDDPELVAHLAEHRVPVEVSPVSNYRLHVVPRDQLHPIRELHDAGVNVSVNSDDPPMFSTDLNREYLLLAEQGFTWEELWRLSRQALEASFLDEAGKAELRDEWDRFAGHS